MADKSWTASENDLIVADYFAMLAEDLAGRSYNKTAHRKALKESIDRTDGSIEFKHQNISAVLKGLGDSWIDGYKPAFNFQSSLVDAVASWLVQNEEWETRTMPSSSSNASNNGLAEANELYIGPPPTMKNEPPPKEATEMMAIARRFDVAARDERNRALGLAGEELVYSHEKLVLRSQGRFDLAERVKWISRDDGDGAGFDIASFDVDGAERLIEVKVTRGWERTPFHISRNELAVSEERSDVWCLLRVFDIARQPRAFELRPPLSRHVELMPTSYQANLR